VVAGNPAAGRVRASRIQRRVAGAEPQGWPEDVHPVLQRVLAMRGLFHPEAIDHRLRGLAAPAFAGLAEACALLAQAIAADQRIVIVGDFDCDGATGTALAVRGLRLLGARHVDYRIPNRFRHGYGLSPVLVETLTDLRPDLIITVDNGIASHAGVAAARARGMRVVVTDHHLPGDSLPDADAIANPRLARAGAGDTEHPGALVNLAGVGVMFYVLLALRRQLHGAGAGPDLAALLDLVALGTVADLVPLDRNNRILVEAGLKRIRAGRACAGILALFVEAGRDPARAVAADLGYAIGPRVNAAGRLEDMSVGIECLLADDADRARELGERLAAINRERRGLQLAMVGQAEAAMAGIDQQAGAAARGVVLYRPDWHPGIVGLVASRLKDTLNRPVVACALAEPGATELRASARSVAGFHVRDALAAVDAREPGLILRFGGHAMAAGLCLALADLERFRDAFDAVVREQLGDAVAAAVLLSDGELAPADFAVELARTLRYAMPWGQGCAEPLFDNLFELDGWRVVGDGHWRLRLRLRPAAAAAAAGNQPALEAILFNAVGERPPARLRAVYQLDLNDWNGRERLQLLLRHVEPA
jgi:single-stranded-DNA-specific exonuclease